MKKNSQKPATKSKPAPSERSGGRAVVVRRVTVRLVPKEGYAALHPVFRNKVWHGFRDGASTLRLRRKYSLTQGVVEQIIRDHMKAPNE